MADAILGKLLHHVRQRSAGFGDRSLSDEELLHAFLGEQDPEAFAVLVRRHGPMVLNVCRRVLHQQQDAEDAFQATFLTLARKAGSIGKQHALASYLYGVAYRAARTLKRAATRRRIHEARARLLLPADPCTDVSWREVQALLEEEIQRLPDKYRMVFVLCCVESRCRAEAARLLGLHEGTLSSRLAQARKMLQHRLARRGVTLSAILAATAVAQPAAARVPAALLIGTTQAAVAFGTRRGLTAGIVSAKVAGLAAELARRTITARLALLTALALTLGVIVASAGLLALSNPAGPPPDARRIQQAGSDRPAEVLLVRNDRQGDPLPPGVLARLGTVRFRHGSTVTGLAFRPDGKTLVSGSYDKTLRVWDITTGRELLRLPPLMGSVFNVSLSADGKTVAADDNSSLYLGDLTTGQLTRPLLKPLEARTCVALSPDGKTIAAGCWDIGVGRYTLRLWETATGKPLGECTGHKDKVTCVVFSPDGKTLASCCADGTVRLWDVNTRKETLCLHRKKAIMKVAFSSDGRVLADGGADGRLGLWRLPGGKLLHELGDGRLNVETIAFSPDRKTVAASGSSELINLWDLQIGKLLRRLSANPTAIAFSQDGRTLASGGHDCTIRLWDVATGNERTPAAIGHGSPVRGVVVAGDGTVATCGGDRFIRLWDAATGREVRRIRTQTPFLPHLALSPDGKVIASNYCLWDRASGKEIGRFKGQVYSIDAMAFSPDSRTLATGTADDRSGKQRKIRLWDVATVKEIRQFGTQGVRALSYAPGSRMLAAGNADGTLTVWDVTTGREAWRIAGHQREVNSVAYSPDGKAVASSSFDGDLLVRDAATGKQVRRFIRPGVRPERPNIHAVAFAPNGKMIASAEGPFTSRKGACITLWEVDTGRVRLRLVGHQGDVNAIAFAPDSRTLISGSTDTTALVWDVMGLPRTAAARGLDACWDDLVTDDAAVACRALCTLATSPAGVRFLQKHLSATPTPDARRIARLIKDLDSDHFAERNAASQELEKRGEAAEPALRMALGDRPSLEVRQRLERLLNKLSSEWRRTKRALEALEFAGTPAAQRVLHSLAQGAPEARQTQEAKAALKRWSARKPAATP
jgi:RNA polymerase sigma factor (sigma-70 family)